MQFAQAQVMFKDNKIRDLAKTPEGFRFLILRSLSRKEYLEKLFSIAGISPTHTGIKAMLEEAFNSKSLDIISIYEAIYKIYEQERSERREREEELISELYKMQVFDWGGLHQNSLEKTIVNSYIKKISNYDNLLHKIDNDLHKSMRGYVECSWYNHWTSIIIEDIFKDHSAVLPAVGLIKKIDFFINGVPFDLKVTYLPEGFVKDQRRLNNRRSELTLLKQSARKHRIHFDEGMPDNQLLEDLWIKHRDHPSGESQSLVSDLESYRVDLIAKSQADATDLIRWLYENQGSRRFDASNRLFLILVDRSNFFQSWKLKRAKPLLHQRIFRYLDGLGRDSGQQLDFNWEGTSYTVVSDVVFIVHPEADN